jgi:hypothetical protein
MQRIHGAESTQDKIAAALTLLPLLPSESLTPWEQININEVAAMAYWYGRSVSGEWGHAILVPNSLFMRGPRKGVSVAGGIIRVAKPGELVYVNFDSDDDVPRLERMRRGFHFFNRTVVKVG